MGISQSTDDEKRRRDAFYELYSHSPIPENERLGHVGLYIRRQFLSRFFYLNELYKQIIPRNGIIIEFGVRWGQNMAILSNLRGLYEPYNMGRRIVGFDTFTGFPEVGKHDGAVKVGDNSVTPDYVEHLRQVLAYHESESPIPQVRKFELIEGDVRETLPRFLEQHPETIIAMAHFDMDLYEPTKEALRDIQPYLTMGSIIAFDELNDPYHPGETVAMREVLGTSHYAIRRVDFHPMASYIMI